MVGARQKEVKSARETQMNHILYSRNAVHSYSKSIQKLFDLAIDYIDYAEESSRKGKNVVWTNGVWESPLIYADGAIATAWGEMGRISGTEALDVAENLYQFPPEICSMAKSVAGGWYLRRNSSIKKILAVASNCEPFNQVWEIIQSEGYDIYTMETVYRAPGVTGERYDQLLRFFIDEIYGAQEWLTGSREIDRERLSAEIRRKNLLMRQVREIMDLRLEHPFYARSIAVLYLLNGLRHYFGRPEEYGEAVSGLLDELKALPPDKKEKETAIPLVWSGANGQEFGVYEAIDNANGALLAFVSTPYSRSYREDIDPVESIARFLLDGQMAGASIYRRNAIEKLVDQVHARGIILYGYLGCSYSGIAREMHRAYFHQKGIPSINLEGTFEIGEPTGQLLTRIRAFIEMLS